MSLRSDEGVTLLFDLYEWKHVSDGGTYVWKNDGHTVEAEYTAADDHLEIVLRLANGHVERFPPITGFVPANDDDIRRRVEDLLAGNSGRW